MNIWHNLKGLLKRETGSDGAPRAIPRTGAMSLWPLERDTALNVATVYRCVRLISESVANLPVQVLRLKGGIYVEDESSPLWYLLNVQPSEACTAFDFWRGVVAAMLLDGNAYVVPSYDLWGSQPEICRLALCARTAMSHDTTADTYTASDAANGVQGVYGEDEVLHFINMPDPADRKRGMGTLAHARVAVGIAATGDRETRDRFQNGGNVRGLLTDERSIRGMGALQDAELAKAAINIDGRFRAGERVVSLPGKAEFQQLSMTSADMEFLASRKFEVREICRFFGVPPTFIYDDTSNNYKSAEQANVAFLSNTLNPLLRGIENEMLRKLVPPRLARKYRIQFDRRGLYACDLESRAKYQAMRLANGTATVNDLRREENLPPVDGGCMALVSANLKSAAQIASEAGQAAGNGNNKDNDNTESDGQE